MKLLLCAGFALCRALPSGAQALAHKGWVGNGFSVQTWWKSAVFYELDPIDFQDANGDGFGDLAGLTTRLDYLETLGVDALVLSPFRLQPAATGGQARWDAVYGTEDDFDKLEQEASRRHLRIVVDLQLDRAETAEQTAAAARFWLSRGVAGLRLRQGSTPLSAEDSASRLRLLRRLCASYAGERVLVGDAAIQAGAVIPQAFAVRRAGLKSKATPRVVEAAGAGVQLTLDDGLASLTGWNAPDLRTILASEGDAATGRVAVSDGPERVRTPGRLDVPGSGDASTGSAVARQLAVLLFAGREWSMLYFGQELGMASQPGKAGPEPMQWGERTPFTTGSAWIPAGPSAETANVAKEEANPDSLLLWYRKLSGLRHSETALRAGTLTLLDSGYPDVVAWVRRGVGENARATPVLVVLNLSSQRTVVSMRDSLHRVGLEASSGVRPLAVSPATPAPSFTASSIALEGYGVYVGALRQAGLEASSVSSRRGRHRGR